MIKSNWDYRPLSELCKNIGDGIHATPQYVNSSEYSFINGNNLKNGSIVIDENTKKVNKEEYEKYYVDLNYNTLLMSINGTLGSLAFYRGEKVILGKSAAYIICSSINKYFCYYYLKLDNVKKHLYDEATGSTIKNLSLKSLNNLLIPVPSDKEQQKIASVLSSLDSKIEINNRINSELESLAKTIYDYWFVQFDFPDENGRPYKSSGGKMVWNEQLKRKIPEDWKIVNLEEFINIYDSKRIPLSSQERNKIKGSIPYYGATGVMDYVNDYIFDGEYILLAEDGSIMDDKGYPIVQYIWGKSWVNNHAHVIQPKDTINYEYLFHFLKSIFVINIMTGSIQKKINQENLMKQKIILPKDYILKYFYNINVPIRRKIINIIEENQKLSELRDWLLPMLMNGQVTVK